MIGRLNAGYVIIEYVKINDKEGYCLAHNNWNYVTWYFNTFQGYENPSFAYGNYFPIDKQQTNLTYLKAKLDMVERAIDYIP